MQCVKKLIKRFLCLLLNFTIQLLNFCPSKKISKSNLLEYEINIRKLYNPNPYKYKQIKNLPLNPKISLSIIIPVYNSLEFIKECIDSILSNKTKYTYEVLIINDGSTDDSIKILNTYNDKRIRIITQQNKGAAAARNTGLNYATGKYVAFIDSDDYIADNFIECLLSKAIENDADIVKCGYCYDTDGILKKRESDEFKFITGLKEKVLEFEGYCWMSVIKRDILFKIRFPENYWYEDMIVRPLILGRCVNIISIKDCLYFYRQHKNNISKKVEHSTNYKCLSQFYLPRYIYNYCKEANFKIDYLNEILFKELQVITYSRLKNIPKKIQKEIFYLNCTFFKKLKLKKIITREDKLYVLAFTKYNYLLYMLLSLKLSWKE